MIKLFPVQRGVGDQLQIPGNKIPVENIYIQASSSARYSPLLSLATVSIRYDLMIFP